MIPSKTVAALAALIALAGCSPKSEPAAPAAPPAASPSADVFNFKIGALDATALKDGDLLVPNDGKTFGVGRPISDVTNLLKAAGQPTDILNLSIQPLLVRGEGKILLFDAGAAGVSWAPQAGKLAAPLRAAGVEPAQVTDIFISHSHGDHIGGLVLGSGLLAFPNAAIHISAPEWQAMQADASLAPTVAAIAPKIAAFQPGAVILPGLVTAVAVKGHTPGHSAYEIASGDERLLYIGDAAHHFVVSVRKPDWTIDYDGDAPTAQASRRALFKRAAEQNLRLYAPHFPFPGVGRVRAEDDGFVWVPE
ncbi:MAG: MBL fold metallo-hydrolase [Phenylobacterium sp.]|uniref:MBL fold metallo-hydrolase n=1 Tax=Phenylobacterium sp. TaxID=1871053 RepID=UPI002734E6B8|nr:MBL fold metallo-hydrolase [Phenylobacterium sp.]MDP3748859.1 MBL fold metallo-hydrolase [Phenylobacterium sp.]